MDSRNEREAARAQAIRAERERWHRLPAEERARWNRLHTEWARSRSGRELEQACEQLSDAATRAALDAYALTQLIARQDNAPLGIEWFEAGRRLLTGMALCDGSIEALRRLSVLYDLTEDALAAHAGMPQRQARLANVRPANVRPANVREPRGAGCDAGDAGWDAGDDDEDDVDGRETGGWVYDTDA